MSPSNGSRPGGLIRSTATERVTLSLPVEFGNWLRNAYGLTPEQVLIAFAHDLRGTDESNGGDERRLAEEWFDRVQWPGAG